MAIDNPIPTDEPAPGDPGQEPIVCDLAITNFEVRPPLPGSNQGYVSYTLTTSRYPVTVELVEGSYTGFLVLTLTPHQTFPALTGTFKLRLTDAGGCVVERDFTMGDVPISGCMNPKALNYNPQATVEDNSCVLPIEAILGCTNRRANNYDPQATQDDGSCSFGSSDITFDYKEPACTTLVFSEPENKWATEQTSKPQMLLPIDGRHVHALPLPGQSNDAPEARYLWEHNTGPDIVVPPGSTTEPGLMLYGRRHKTWIEVIILGAGVHTIKNLDNLVLAANDELPGYVVVSVPEQGSFRQLLVDGRTRLSTIDRQEQLTYVQLVPPEDAPWGGRIRAPYIRLRIEFVGRKQLRLSKLFAILRESVT